MRCRLRGCSTLPMFKNFEHRVSLYRIFKVKAVWQSRSRVMLRARASNPQGNQIHSIIVSILTESEFIGLDAR